MRIAFDYNPILINKYSGFYAYGAGLLRGFEALSEKPEFLLFYSRCFSNQAKLIKKGIGEWAQLSATFVKMRWLENLWCYSKYPKLQFFTGEFDIYHSTHHLMPPTKNKPRILTVYDLRRYKISELYKKSKLDLFESALKRADHFISISEATKKDLCSLFKIADSKVDVVHLASHAMLKPVLEPEKKELKKQLSKRLGVELENYLLVFSSPDRRKNISRTINAFLSAEKKLSNHFKLIVVGNLPKKDKEFNSINFSKLTDSIVLTGPLDDIKDLFCCANCLVFASLYEGFGVPIVEAFSCRVPVITSNCSSMPEVAGDAALHVDPYSTESISEAMIKICNNRDLREKLIRAGTQRCKEFNWEKTAAKTLEVYKKLL